MARKHPTPSASTATPQRYAFCLHCSWTCTGFGTKRSAQRHSGDHPDHEVHSREGDEINLFWRGQRVR